MPFQKGQSGNPGGRPKGLVSTVRDRYGRKAFKILVAIMEGRVEELAYTKEGEKIAVAPQVKEVREAAKTVLAYCWGNPATKLELPEDDQGRPFALPIVLQAVNADTDQNGAGGFQVHFGNGHGSST